MIVVDTNILASLLLPTPDTEMAEAAFVKDPDWCSPLLWRSELRNVVANLMRLQRLELAQACRVLEQAEQVLALREIEPPDFEVLQLAEDSGCTAYDCEFVAVARQLDAPLVTLDQQILRKFPRTAITLTDFASDPAD